jgi:hypothetical protein
LESLLDTDFFTKDKYTFPNYNILMKFFTKFTVETLNSPDVIDIFAIDNIRRPYDYFNNNNRSEISFDKYNKFHSDSSNNITRFINNVLNNNSDAESDILSPIGNNIKLSSN